MLLPVNFLNLYFKKPLSTDSIVTALEKTEVEVESIITSNNLDVKIVTARVLKTKQHPNADRLKVAEVLFGKTKAKVVCGAPNIREGQVVAYAKPGAILPSGDKIEQVVLRGEKSSGMICSERELGRGDDHSGIAVLDPDLPLGISLCDIDNMGDIVDIKTPTNRPDMLSVYGLAREIFANSVGTELAEPEHAKIEFRDREVVKVKETVECKRFVSAVLQINIQSKTPDWIVENLQAAGMRPINPIVDITNFVMLETGQPSHAYDKTKLKGNLQVRFAKNNETITTLDGVDRKLSKEDIVIADNSSAIGLAGVMGGVNTEVDNNTKEIVLEVANFNATRIRRSANRHGIRTEASARFEKGLPLPLSIYATERLLYLFKTICQAKIINGPFDQLYDWPWIQHTGLRIRKAEKFLGLKLNEKEVINGLRKRGFEAEQFSITKEAKKHLGKPYKWGANFKEDGINAFDCSYLIDYVYSLIGVYIGHTALAQFEHGEAIEVSNLKPGDVVFYKGKIENSVDDHYYLKDNHGKHVKQQLRQKKEVGHNGLYIGNNKVVMAAMYEYKNKKWVKRNNQEVIEVDLKEFANNPGYLGARRYVDNFNHTVAVTAPWWRDDIKIEQDLYEEVAKIVGYENMPATLPQLPPTNTADHQLILKAQELKNNLVTNGLYEVMTYSFVSHKQLQLAKSETDKHFKIVNPLSKEQEFLRSTLIMSHIQTAVNNRDYWKESYGFFEVSRVYNKSKNEKHGKSETWKLAITLVGKNSIDRLGTVIGEIAQKYRWKHKIVPGNNNLFVPGRAADILVNNKSIGWFGQVDSVILVNQKFNNEISYAEIEMSQDLLTPKYAKIELPLGYQLNQRDITIEVDSNVWWQDVVDNLTTSDNIRKVQLVSVFINPELIKINKKRLSIRIVLDCGSNPSLKYISKSVDKCVAKLRKHKKFKNLKVL